MKIAYGTTNLWNKLKINVKLTIRNELPWQQMFHFKNRKQTVCLVIYPMLQ